MEIFNYKFVEILGIFYKCLSFSMGYQFQILLLFFILTLFYEKQLRLGSILKSRQTPIIPLDLFLLGHSQEIYRIRF
jgi:hypothetical protein